MNLHLKIQFKSHWGSSSVAEYVAGKSEALGARYIVLRHSTCLATWSPKFNSQYQNESETLVCSLTHTHVRAHNYFMLTHLISLNLALNPRAFLLSLDSLFTWALHCSACPMVVLKAWLSASVLLTGHSLYVTGRFICVLHYIQLALCSHRLHTS